MASTASPRRSPSSSMAAPRSSTAREDTSSSSGGGIGMEELRSWAITMLQAYSGGGDQAGPSSPQTQKAQQARVQGATNVQSMNELLRAARTGENERTQGHSASSKWTDRLRDNDPDMFRLDLSAALLRDMTNEEKQDILQSMARNTSVRIVHLSGLQMMECWTPEEFQQLVEAVGQLPNLQELFVFRGNNRHLSEDLLGRAVESAQGLEVLMLWGYGKLENHPDFAGVLRRHSNLRRITITLPEKRDYACMDIYVMGFAEMINLQCLNLRGTGKQVEPVVSPEAMGVLMSSQSIESLYMEHVGLIDDHTDVICDELRNNNTTLALLDLKDNYFSDDALFTFAQALPHNRTLQSLDLSGVQVTDRGGRALAQGMTSNSTLTHLELEGTAAKYADEFAIVPGRHEQAEWYCALDYQLRLNRAGTTGNRKKFVEALNSVSDHLGCLYTFVRQSPHYCDLHPRTATASY